MTEALNILTELRDSIKAEEWVNKSGQRAVLTGIKLCIAVIEKKLADSEEFTDEAPKR